MGNGISIPSLDIPPIDIPGIPTIDVPPLPLQDILTTFLIPSVGDLFYPSNPKRRHRAWILAFDVISQEGLCKHELSKLKNRPNSQILLENATEILKSRGFSTPQELDDGIDDVLSRASVQDWRRLTDSLAYEANVIGKYQMETLRAAIEDLFNERTELSIYFYRLKLLNNWMIYLDIHYSSEFFGASEEKQQEILDKTIDKVINSQFFMWDANYAVQNLEYVDKNRNQWTNEDPDFTIPEYLNHPENPPILSPDERSPTPTSDMVYNTTAFTYPEHGWNISQSTIGTTALVPGEYGGVVTITITSTTYVGCSTTPA